MSKNQCNLLSQKFNFFIKRGSNSALNEFLLITLFIVNRIEQNFTETFDLTYLESMQSFNA